MDNERKRIYNKMYRYSHKGIMKNWITKCYNRMKRDEKNKFNSTMNFTKDEFIKWLDTKKLLDMLDVYTKSNYNKDLCPSIDRIDDYKDYNFDNIQLITWEENNLKGRASFKNKKQCSDMAKLLWSKKVYQINLSGEIVNEFYSSREAGRQTGIDNSLIARACRLNRIAKGYRWKYG